MFKQRRRLPLSLSAVLIAASAGVGLLAPTAHAAGGAVQVSGVTVRITAQAGKANKIWVGRNGAFVTVIDSGDTLAAGPGCVAEAPNRVKCTSSPDPRYVDVDSGDLADVIDLRPSGGMRSTVHAGPGADQVLGSEGRDTVYGEDGNDNLSGFGSTDHLYGEAGIDSLNGGADNDRFFGGPGADNLIGGPGTHDAAVYNGYTARVLVDLDDVADDGGIGEGDNAHSDLEDLVGGSGDDQLTGNASVNQLDGNDGHDVLTGGANNDVLLGYAGNDTLVGGDGDDYLQGQVGRDTYSGGAGVDEVSYEDEFRSNGKGVTVDLDGVADDGFDFDFENVPSDVEDLTGTSANDTLIADNDANILVGRGGDDVLIALGGNDILRCDEGTNDIGHGGTEIDQATGCETFTGIP